MDSIKQLLFSFLQYTEKFTRTDMVYLARGSFWLSVGQGAAIASSFILSIILAYALPKETFGNYKFVLSIAGIIGGLSLSGIGGALTQAVARGAHGTIYPAIRTQLIWSAGIGIICAGIGIYYLIQNNAILGVSLLVVSATMPLINSFGLYGSFLAGKKDFRRTTLYWISGQLLNTIIVAALAILTQSVIVLITGYFLTNLIAALFGYYATKYHYRPEASSADASMVKYGTHLSAIGFMNTFANHLDKILLFQFIGAAPVAIYTFAFAIPEQVRAFFKNLIHIGIPRFAKRDELELHKSITDKIFRLSIICIVGAVVYYVVAPFLYQFFFPNYLESVFYSQIFMFGIITFPAISLIATYFQLIQKTRILYTLSSIGNLCLIVFSILLIPAYGISGALIKSIISWYLLCIVSGVLFAYRGLKIRKYPELQIRVSKLAEESSTAD